MWCYFTWVRLVQIRTNRKSYSILFEFDQSENDSLSVDDHQSDKVLFKKEEESCSLFNISVCVVAFFSLSRFFINAWSMLFYLISLVSVEMNRKIRDCVVTIEQKKKSLKICMDSFIIHCTCDKRCVVFTFFIRRS